MSELVQALRRLEADVHSGGWDQRTRVFALAPFGDLASQQPELVAGLRAQLAEEGVTVTDDLLVPIEQEWPFPDVELDDALARVEWPPKVQAAAIVVERVILPPEAEQEVAELSDPVADPVQAVHEHPSAQDVRMAVIAARSGEHWCLIRARSPQTDGDVPVPDQMYEAADLVPGLIDALEQTFQ